MQRLSYQRFDYPFQYPFQIAKGIKTHQPSLVVTLSFGALKGRGEATEIHYHNVSVASMEAVLEAKKMMIERFTFTTPERFWHFLHHLMPAEHFLTSAIDIAAWDLYGQMRKAPLYQLLGLEWKNIPPTDYTIGITNAENIAARVAQHPSPIYKLKLGSRQDLDLLKALRKATDAKIRIDVNEGWTLSEAEQILPELEQLDIELIEQPLDKNDIEGMRSLKKLTRIPIIADEAVQTENDLPLCTELYDGINVKLSKCSGITPALSLINKAKAAGMKIMLGSMSEGVVGASALSHLLPLADYADIDGPLLLEDSNFSGIVYKNGIVQQPVGYGIGLR